jgi:hypothetical protein
VQNKKHEINKKLALTVKKIMVKAIFCAFLAALWTYGVSLYANKNKITASVSE